MGMGKQGSKGTAPVSKPMMGKKPGGKVVGGGNVSKGIYTKGVGAGGKKLK